MQDETEDFNFESADLIEVPVSVGGTAYVLREASGEAACVYRDALMALTEMSAEGKPLIKINPKAEPTLVSECLSYKDTGKPVPLATVMSWPNRIVKKLFTKAMQISELEEKEDNKGEAKQPSGHAGTTGG